LGKTRTPGTRIKKRKRKEAQEDFIEERGTGKK
jgi:hypothetical protein